MAELAPFQFRTLSTSSLLLPRSSKFCFRAQLAPPSISLRLNCPSLTGPRNLLLKPPSIIVTRAVASSDSKTWTISTGNVEPSSQGIEIEPDNGNGGNNYGDIGNNGNRGGGGGGGGGGDSHNEGGEGSAEDSNKKKMAMSMSQKLTLGYAALVGVGGLMGYMKSGSQKSLLAGGLSASVLYYVFTQLPTNPVYASSIGLGVASVLTGVMTSRFMKSKKVFPAGVVSLMSMVMAGGYIHGILRSMH
ncbi:Protein FATTY ACID EXPORT 2, chloroplastic [Linum perenne]